jgi:hypothetical protein
VQALLLFVSTWVHVGHCAEIFFNSTTMQCDINATQWYVGDNYVYWASPTNSGPPSSYFTISYATSRCQSINPLSSIAIARSDNDWRVLLSIAANANYFIGAIQNLTALEVEDGWMWLDGTTFDNFAPGLLSVYGSSPTFTDTSQHNRQAMRYDSSVGSLSDYSEGTIVGGKGGGGKGGTTTSSLVFVCSLRGKHTFISGSNFFFSSRLFSSGNYLQDWFKCKWDKVCFLLKWNLFCHHQCSFLYGMSSGKILQCHQCDNLH